MTAPPLVRAVLPAATDPVDPTADEGRRWLAEQYRVEHPLLRLNMVTTLTGAAIGPDGTSDSISNRTDRAILAAIRHASDAIVVGAQTVRTEKYRLPEDRMLAVVTRSGDLGHEVFERSSDASRANLLMVCGTRDRDVVAERAAAVGAEPLIVDASEPTPPAIRDALHARGLTRLVCEGGPSLASQFVAAGIIDELCVTVAPKVGARGEPFLRLDRGPDTAVAAMLVDDVGFSYLRLRPAR